IISIVKNSTNCKNKDNIAQYLLHYISGNRFTKMSNRKIIKVSNQARGIRNSINILALATSEGGGNGDIYIRYYKPLKKRKKKHNKIK
ncbi:hypothetical protein ACJX0J_029105, partial [Zea mays]